MTPPYHVVGISRGAEEEEEGEEEEERKNKRSRGARTIFWGHNRLNKKEEEGRNRIRSARYSLYDSFSYFVDFRRILNPRHHGPLYN